MKSKRPTRRIAKKTTAKLPVRRSAARSNGNGRVHGETRKAEKSALKLSSITPSYTVNDLEKSIRWYRDGLGFTVSDRWEDGGKLVGVMMKAGNVTFALSQDDFSQGRDRVKGVGLRIHADTTQDVDELAKRIRAYGGKVFQEPADMEWGARSFAVEDPDGFRISFNRAR
jgi:uncharacterized glyoxalase superfamily protein PhnB